MIYSDRNRTEAPAANRGAFPHDLQAKGCADATGVARELVYLAALPTLRAGIVLRRGGEGLRHHR